MGLPTQSVDILLATYNGGRFLAEQLRSIELQTHGAWRVIARDDGSTDDTRALLAGFRSRHPAMVDLVEDDGSRLGATGSFHRLLQNSKGEYVLFCDQDDVWSATKIERLLGLMRTHEREGVPFLVHSDMEVVDQGLQPLAASFWRYQFINPANCQCSRLLVQNVVTGCACLFNAALRRAALPIPPEAIMHDWWLALVAAAVGEIRWTRETTVRYRQHGGNDTGAKHWGSAYILGQASEFFHRRTFREKVFAYRQQAAALVRHEGLVTPGHTRTALREFATLHTRSYPKRIGVLLRHRILMTGLIRNFALLARI
jgi:glycosyltransferase involved in cell wall biosynthesis